MQTFTCTIHYVNKNNRDKERGSTVHHCRLIVQLHANLLFKQHTF